MFAHIVNIPVTRVLDLQFGGCRIIVSRLGKSSRDRDVFGSKLHLLQGRRHPGGKDSSKLETVPSTESSAVESSAH